MVRSKKKSTEKAWRNGDKAPEPRGAVSSGLACVFGTLRGKEEEEGSRRTGHMEVVAGVFPKTG